MLMMLEGCSTSFIARSKPLTPVLITQPIKPIPQIDTSHEITKEDWLKGYIEVYSDDKEKTELLQEYQKILSLFTTH